MNRLLIDSIANSILTFLVEPLHLSATIGVIALIVGAFVLWLSAKWLRFRNPSFWTSLGCMALTIGVSAVGVLVMPRSPFWATVGAGFGFAAIVGVISVAWFFRVPVEEAVAAIVLALVSEALWLGMCYAVLAVLVALGIQGLAHLIFR